MGFKKAFLATPFPFFIGLNKEKKEVKDCKADVLILVLWQVLICLDYYDTNRK